MLAMKMLYYKNSWSCANVSDMLQPTAKFQLSGGKLVVAAPYTSLAASIRSTSPGTPVTVASMSHHMLRMDMGDFDEAGGFAVRMVEGDFLWVPEACVIAEFAMSEPEEISTSLSWLAMTEYQCSDDHLENAIQSLQTLLVMCCQPSQKHLESGLKAGFCWGVFVPRDSHLATAGHAAFQKILEIKRKTGNEEDAKEDATPAGALSEPTSTAATPADANQPSGNKDDASPAAPKDDATPAAPAVTGALSEPPCTAATPAEANQPSGNKDDASPAAPGSATADANPPAAPAVTGALSEPTSTAATPADANQPSGNKDDASPAARGSATADANPPAGNKDDATPAAPAVTGALSEPPSTAATPADANQPSGNKDDASPAAADANGALSEPTSTAATPADANQLSGNKDDASPAAPGSATADANPPSANKNGATPTDPAVTGALSEPTSTAATPADANQASGNKDDASPLTTGAPASTTALNDANAGLGPAVLTTGAPSQPSSTAATPANDNANAFDGGSNDASSKSQPDRHVMAADGNQPEPSGAKDCAPTKAESTDPKINPEAAGVCDLVIDILSSQEDEPADGHPTGPCTPEPKTIAAATAMDVSSEEDAVNDPEVNLNTGKDGHTTKNMADTETEKPTVEIIRKEDENRHDSSDSDSESSSTSAVPPSSRHGLAEDSDDESMAPTPKAEPKRRARAKPSPKAKAKGKAKAKSTPKQRAKNCKAKASPKPKPATACKSKAKAKAKDIAEKLSEELQKSGSGKRRKRKSADE
eukprot:s2951_g1.t1